MDEPQAGLNDVKPGKSDLAMLGFAALSPAYVLGPAYVVGPADVLFAELVSRRLG
jgi:hypothetical protein